MSRADKPINAIYQPHMQLGDTAGPGMTLLEHYAGLAMQGIISNPYWNEHGDFSEVGIARCAVDMAKALIAQLEDEGK